MGRLPGPPPPSRHSLVCGLLDAGCGDVLPACNCCIDVIGLRLHELRRPRLHSGMQGRSESPLQHLTCHLRPHPSTAPLPAGPLAAGRWQVAEGEAGLRAQLGDLIDRFQQLTQVRQAHILFDSSSCK